MLIGSKKSGDQIEVLKRFTSSEPSEMRDKAYRLCREFLSGSWKSISSGEMVFKSINGGMSNLIYYCSLPETHTPLSGEPSQVLLRVYGQVHGGHLNFSITESVIFMMLSERKLGPKLYGIFPEGRLEEYIPAHPLTTQQLRNPKISNSIAWKLGKVHTLQVPIKKEPTWLMETFAKWIKGVRTNFSVDKIPEKNRPLAEQLLKLDLEGEIEFLRNYLPSLQSPVVFCHNDLQEGNILLPDNADEDKLVFIDFEYCSYNYRGFDLANHFCEWCFDYTSEEYPHFASNLENFPTLDQQKKFIQTYLESYHQNTEGDKDDTEEKLLREVNSFVLAVNLLWGIWCINNAIAPKIPFGYLEHGKVRLDFYYQHKKKLFSPKFTPGTVQAAL